MKVVAHNYWQNTYKLGSLELILWTCRNYIFTGETRCAGCLCTSSGWFKRVEPPRTFSNHRDSKVCRVLSHEFGVVRLYRTFSNYIFTGEARCAGCFCTSSGWFKRIEPPRTFSNHIIAEIARCVEFFHMSSGWFDCPEPSLTTSFQGKQGVQGAYALVRGGSSAPRTFSKHIIAEIARCVEFFHMSSGWFDCTELSRTTSLQGVQGAYALVLGGSSASNLLEPSRTTSLQR